MEKSPVYLLRSFFAVKGDPMVSSLRESENQFVMSVKIRLKRVGARNHPVYRVVVADSRSPRDGKFIEEIGTYHPARTSDKVTLDLERIDHWVGHGAIVSDTVKSFVRAAKRAALASAAEPAPAPAAAPAPAEVAAE
jgi:small subunit ribosomal protein S16